MTIPAGNYGYVFVGAGQNPLSCAAYLAEGAVLNKDDHFDPSHTPAGQMVGQCGDH